MVGTAVGVRRRRDAGVRWGEVTGDRARFHRVVGPAPAPRLLRRARPVGRLPVGADVGLRAHHPIEPGHVTHQLACWLGPMWWS